jgi:ABC-type molybdenum transport system ATPase subunit/photorepair protein PhrA
VLAVGRLNVVTGPNGSGKSSLYRHAYRSRVAELCQPRGLSATREFSDDVDMWVRMRMEVKV